MNIKNRWKDIDFLTSLPIKNESIELNLLNNLDLRGVPKLGCGEPLWKFPNIFSTIISNLKISYGSGAVVIHNSKIINLECIDFKFDQSSSFNNSTFKNSVFEKSKLKFNATDVEFHECDFTESTLKGGLREYGFRRCKFYNCKFNSAQWQNTYLFACQFINCDFTEFKIIKSLIRGFKVNELSESIYSIFEDCEIDGLTRI